MDFAAQLYVLEATQGDPAKLALATVDLTYPELSEPERAVLKEALEAAAIPNWCDSALLAALLGISPEESEAILNRLRRLTVLEPFPARGEKAVNVHAASRAALRSGMARRDQDRFRKLRVQAAKYFRQDHTPAGRIEWIQHCGYLTTPMSTPSSTADQTAAQELLTELRTRISTQPLPYQLGIEASALQSMWQVFGQARDAMKRNPGAEQFAARTTEVLNLVVRPLTAKWHRAFEEGRLNGRDGADEFRGELQDVQEKLRAFAMELHLMAYGKPREDILTPEVMGKADMEEIFRPLSFGFTAHTLVPEAVAEVIRNDEAEAVAIRRGKKQIATAAGTDAIGLALSGGGIRSATFGLGVVQVLAEKGFIEEVDFLSTVSGGGYTGCFLTQRLGNDEPLSDVAAPRGPDPEPVRYVRQRAKFLSANNLTDKWSMVTATLAGTLLNWTAPILVILILALVVAAFGKPSHDEWFKVILGGAALSVVAMVGYGWGMRQGKKASQVTGSILGVLLAVTTVLGVGLVLEKNFPKLIEAIGKQ